MMELTVENLFNQIVQLPPPEQNRLWRMLEPVVKAAPVENGKSLSAQAMTAEPLRPISVPDDAGERQWMQDHAREYIGQWVALDGNRLIAHGTDAKTVYAAARADGAYLPLVELVTDPDRPCLHDTTPPVSSENGAPPTKKIEPIPRPDRTREMRWLKEHGREHIGQWVALDGDRLIAHGFDAKAVYAAARADGAYLPLVDSIEDPDLPFVF